MQTDIGAALSALPATAAGFWQTGLNALLNNLATAFLIAAVVVATFFLLYGAILWIVSGSDKEKLASAQKTITAALIGLIIALSAFAIMALIRHFFGIGGASGTLVGPRGAPATPPGEERQAWVDCCEHPEVYGKNGFTVPVAECKAARANPQRRQCVADGQEFRWYQHDVIYCDQFFINKGCWESH